MDNYPHPPKQPKTTLVIGASDNPARTSYQAIHLLRKLGHPVWGLGRKKTMVDGVSVSDTPEAVQELDTVTLYLNPDHQQPLYPYLLALHPKRVIFNPGTENPELEELLEQQGITCLNACTLVLLHTGQY